MSKEPCPQCPFSRTVTPNALGGSPPEVYIGQSVLQFWLPCHMNAHYAGKQSDPGEVNECHGAAIFRTHIKDETLYEQPVLKLPENKELVFGSLAEFYAHHKNLPVEIAAAELTKEQIKEWAIKEWTNVQKQLILRDKETGKYVCR